MSTGLNFKNTEPTAWPRCKWPRCNFIHQDPQVVADHEAVCDRRVVLPTYEERRANVQRNRRRQEINVGRPSVGGGQKDNRDIDDLLASIETPGAAVPAVLPPRLIKARQLKVLPRPRVVVSCVRAILRKRRAAVLPLGVIATPPLLDSPSSSSDSLSPPLHTTIHSGSSQSARVNSALPIDSAGFHRTLKPFRPASVHARQPRAGSVGEPPRWTRGSAPPPSASIPSAAGLSTSGVGSLPSGSVSLQVVFPSPPPLPALSVALSVQPLLPLPAPLVPPGFGVIRPGFGNPSQVGPPPMFHLPPPLIRPFFGNPPRVRPPPVFHLPAPVIPPGFENHPRVRPPP